MRIIGDNFGQMLVPVPDNIREIIRKVSDVADLLKNRAKLRIKSLITPPIS